MLFKQIRSIIRPCTVLHKLCPSLFSIRPNFAKIISYQNLLEYGGKSMLKVRANNNISCHTCESKQLCLGARVEEDALNELDSMIINIKHVKKGEHIFNHNDSLKNIYAIHTGSSKDFILKEDGTEHISNFYFSGDIIGLESIPNQTYFFSMTALEDTTLCVIPLDDLMTLIQSNGSLLKRFINIFAYRMQNDHQVNFNTNAPQRVAGFILNIILRLEERKPAENYQLPMGQIDISNFLGMSHETVNRIIKKLCRDKVIELNKKTIRVLNLEELKRIASHLVPFGQN